VAESWYLVTSSGPEAGSAFHLMGSSITIGRSAGNDIVVDDPQVSRRHARLDLRADTYILTDLGSANGTWVNGQRIAAPVTLRAGDSITFGKGVDFALSTQPSSAEAAPPKPPPASMPHPERQAGTPAWVYIIGGLAVLCLLAGLLGGGALYLSSRRATVAPLAQETATVQVQEAAVTQGRETALAQEQETAVAQARETAIAQVRGTATTQAQETVMAQVQETAVAQAQETAIAQVQGTATAQAQEAATAQVQETATGQAQFTPLPPPITPLPSASIEPRPSAITPITLKPTPRSVNVGQIAFVSNRDGNDEIYVMNPDGSSQRRLTNTPGEEWHPDWSPDGTRIVFQCMSGDTSNVCLVNADGSGYTQLTHWTKDDGAADRPVWSPDGQKIAVSGGGGPGGQALVVMNADGSNQTEIAKLGQVPSWSPDGTRIAFVRYEGGGLQIWTMSPDGSNARALTQGSHNYLYPTWSPDGSQIAFENVIDAQNAQVAVMDAGGGPPRIVADKGSNNLSWSPDGGKLVISPPGEGIWLVNADGSGLTQIAQEGKQPSWQAVP
jgi:hypothetical protein